MTLISDRLRKNFKDNANQFDGYMTEMLAHNTELEAALAELVALKKHKDKYGKTQIYEDRQPEAWERAFAILTK